MGETPPFRWCPILCRLGASAGAARGGREKGGDLLRIDPPLAKEGLRQQERRRRRWIFGSRIPAVGTQGSISLDLPVELPDVPGGKSLGGPAEHLPDHRTEERPPKAVPVVDPPGELQRKVFPLGQVGRDFRPPDKEVVDHFRLLFEEERLILLPACEFLDLAFPDASHLADDLPEVLVPLQGDLLEGTGQAGGDFLRVMKGKRRLALAFAAEAGGRRAGELAPCGFPGLKRVLFPGVRGGGLRNALLRDISAVMELHDLPGLRWGEPHRVEDPEEGFAPGDSPDIDHLPEELVAATQLRPVGIEFFQGGVPERFDPFLQDF